MEGFTGADIEAVCREAALICMRAGKERSQETLSKKHITSAPYGHPRDVGLLSKDGNSIDIRIEQHQAKS